MNASEFLLWWTELPVSSFRYPARCFASPYVGDDMRLTISLRGTSALWIFSRPHSLVGTVPCGDSFLAVSSGIPDFLVRRMVFLSIFLVGSF